MSGRDTVSPRSADRMTEHNRSVLFRRRRRRRSVVPDSVYRLFRFSAHLPATNATFYGNEKVPRTNKNAFSKTRAPFVSTIFPPSPFNIIFII